MKNCNALIEWVSESVSETQSNHGEASQLQNGYIGTLKLCVGKNNLDECVLNYLKSLFKLAHRETSRDALLEIIVSMENLSACLPFKRREE